MSGYNVYTKQQVECELDDLGIRIDGEFKLSGKGRLVGRINFTKFETVKGVKVPFGSFHLPIWSTKDGSREYIQSDYDQYTNPRTQKTYSSIQLNLDLRNMLLEHWKANATTAASVSDETVVATDHQDAAPIA